jgi:hypothetical protein
VRPEGLCERKFPMAVSGIESATFRFVAQCVSLRLPLSLIFKIKIPICVFSNRSPRGRVSRNSYNVVRTECASEDGQCSTSYWYNACDVTGFYIIQKLFATVIVAMHLELLGR